MFKKVFFTQGSTRKYMIKALHSLESFFLQWNGFHVGIYLVHLRTYSDCCPSSWLAGAWIGLAGWIGWRVWLAWLYVFLTARLPDSGMLCCRIQGCSRTCQTHQNCSVAEQEKSFLAWCKSETFGRLGLLLCK